MLTFACYVVATGLTLRLIGLPISLLRWVLK